jgi:hypothetical protein
MLEPQSCLTEREVDSMFEPQSSLSKREVDSMLEPQSSCPPHGQTRLGL